MKKILSLSVLLVTALLILAACQSASTTNKATNNANKSAPNVAATQGHTDDAPRINLEDAKKDFDAGNAIFVDTRNKSAYDAEHIKGSINITMSDVEARFKELQTDKKIIAYCSWPAEHTSAGLVTQLKAKGINNAYALVGGTNAWKSAGYPMENAPPASSNSNSNK